MKMFKWCLFGTFLLPFQLNLAGAQEGLTPRYLRTEYRVNPVGIDTVQPRLSWFVESPERGQSQTAYRIVVADDLEHLKSDAGPFLWDSGKIESDETTAVFYDGQPLESRMLCFWRVMVWDRHGKASSWSEPAEWAMGLLEKSDWHAQWIGYDQPVLQQSKSPGSHPIEQAKWIWYPEDDPAQKAPLGTRYFRRMITIPDGKRILDATFVFAVDNECDLFVNGKHIVHRSGFDSAWQDSIAPYIQPGLNVIAIAATNVGDAPNPAGFLAAIHIKLDGAGPIVVRSDASWKTASQVPNSWATIELDDTDWHPAQELGENGSKPWKKVSAMELRLPPPRYLRQEFSLNKPVRRALLFGTALGIYELYLNGNRVGQDYLTPGWTDYRKRVYYQAYDVTDQLHQGSNVVGGILADGWYAGYYGWQGKRDYYGDRIRLRAQLEVEFEDGTTQIVATGPQWRAATGALWEADLLMGERYDARFDPVGWDQPNFDASTWQPVDITDAISPLVQAHPGEPVRSLEPIRPIEITEPEPGHYVVNLGQNFAGVVRIRARGEAGRLIRIRHAERLQPDGTLYTTNLRGARATDVYICRGDENGRWWQPRFTFHGFQYIEITGYPARPTIDDILGIPLTSNTPIVGHFECSDPMINQLLSNIYWTQAANFIDIPTDCPQRDERLGWTGDAQIYVRTASLIADIQSFFTKWLIDLDDAQRDDGQYPKVAPLLPEDFLPDGGPAWADAGVICPWNIYEVYGDRNLLETHYGGMTRFIEFCEKRSTPDLLPPKTFHCFGDWLNIDDNTPNEVIYMAYFAHSTELVRCAALALGKEGDAQKYQALGERIQAAFQKAYVQADGRIHGDTQTAYVLAIAFHLVDGAARDAAAQRLVELIEGRDWHLSTGFIGTKDLMLVLSQIGRDDVAYRLLHNKTFPSWGFSIQHGATSIWERWDGWTPEKGFNNPGMNSFAHYSFGAVAQWIFETIGGIRTKGPGFKEIVIQPKPGGELTWAKARYRSIRGHIVSEWKTANEQLTLDVVIPANTTAEVHVPAKPGSTITESGQPAAESPGVELLRSDNKAAVFRLQSGSYSFEVRP
ncbi:MAG: family 78 glycoside hydrolase catalytic domain [Pirellulales bacterium]|nr:family 78 glycoside hydrolase catalytic domain [Pirellulales bacterium]